MTGRGDEGWRDLRNEHTVQRCGSAEEDGGKIAGVKRGLRWRWWQTGCGLFLLPPATFFTLPVFSSAALIYSPPLLPFELMCHFMLHTWFIFSPLLALSVWCALVPQMQRPVCVCVYLCETILDSSTYHHFPLFPKLSLSFFLSPSEIRCCHSPQPLFFFITLLFAPYLSSELRFDALSTLSLTWIFCLCLCLYKHPLPTL